MEELGMPTKYKSLAPMICIKTRPWHKGPLFTFDYERGLKGKNGFLPYELWELDASLQIPFILLDSYLPDLKPLAFFGQDSFQSGYFAARMLMLIANKETEIMLMKHLKDGHIGSKQQNNRETGFRHYMHDHFPEIKITEIDLPLGASREDYDQILEEFFTTHRHKGLRCAVRCSSAEARPAELR